MLQTTQAQCGASEEAYLEISTADSQTDDRYCGVHLSQVGDGAIVTDNAISAGVVYGKMIQT